MDLGSAAAAAVTGGGSGWLGFSLAASSSSSPVAAREEEDGGYYCFGPVALPPPPLQLVHVGLDWSYAGGGGGDGDDKGPKLEDFMGGSVVGGGYSDHSADQETGYVEHDRGGAPPPPSPVPALQNAYLFHGALDINVNAPPLFDTHESHQQPNATSAYNTGYEGLPSISGIKSWLRQQGAWLPERTSALPGAAAAGVQSLSLSMGPGHPDGRGAATTDLVASAAALRKPPQSFGQRTSQYRGVTRHRWTGRYEAHLWDNSCRKEGQTRKGRQVYLGGYDKEEKAARAYDLAALKYWGPTTHINFSLSSYEKELEEMKHMTRQEFIAHLRRNSSGFSRGASMYRGVTRHHQHGRWQARIGRVAGNKDLYLGTFSTQEEAAEAYDIAAIKFRGVNAVTNFDIKKYDVKRICVSNTFLTGTDLTMESSALSDLPAAASATTLNSSPFPSYANAVSGHSLDPAAASYLMPPPPHTGNSGTSFGPALPARDRDQPSTFNLWSD